MTYRHFYDKDAAPVPGKSPVQMRVRGGPASSTVQAGVNAALNAFLAGSRISEAPNLQKTVALPDGTTVRMRSRFGQVIVDVVIPPQIEEPEEKEDFYGGIVIRPYCLTNETEYLAGVAGSVAPVDFTLPEATNNIAARPAVPTREPNDPTTHIVVQIRNNVPLDDSPVARGYVKIFRIKDPLLGVNAEVAKPGRYTVSANAELTEFYLCGKRLTKVPSMALPPAPILGTEPGLLIRLRAIGFKPSKFESAASATGILIVAVDTKLYAVDAGATSPAWTLLATADYDDTSIRSGEFPTAFANDFGDMFTETILPGGALQVTCSGSNGAGVCSGFTVTVTPVPGSRPTVSGTIVLMHDGTTPRVVTPATSYSALEITNTSTPGSSMGQPTYIEIRPATRTDGGTEESIQARVLVDRFRGGTLASAPPHVSSFSSTATATGEFLAWIPVIVEGSTVDETPSYTEAFSFEYERVVNGFIDTATYTRDYPGTSGTYSRTITGPTDRPPAQHLRLIYTGKDLHTGKLAWRRDYQRSSTATGWSAQTGLPADELHPETFPMDGTNTVTFSPLLMAHELLRPAGPPIVRWDGFPEKFGVSTPAWAGTFAEVESGYEKYVLPNSPIVGVGTVQAGVEAAAGIRPWLGAYINSGTFGVDLRMTVPIYYNVSWGGPVGIYRRSFFSLTGIGIGIAEPVPYPTASVSISWDSTTTPSAFAIDDYQGYFYPTSYDDFWLDVIFDDLTDKPEDGGTGSVFTITPQPAFNTPGDTTGITEPRFLNKLILNDVALYDIRTRGFIAWSLARTENVEDVSWVYNATALIGNDVSVVPLRDVIDEWRNLSTPDPASDLKIVFYEAPAEVSLL